MFRFHRPGFFPGTQIYQSGKGGSVQAQGDKAESAGYGDESARSSSRGRFGRKIFDWYAGAENSLGEARQGSKNKKEEMDG